MLPRLNLFDGYMNHFPYKIPTLASVIIMFACIGACTGMQGADDQDSIIFKGICDGSAAVKLGDGSILVAYDELNTLYTYSISGGIPIASIDLSNILNLKTKNEIDIEAGTVSGDRIWWIGSHSSDKKGKHAPNRHMLFATNIPSADLSDLLLVNEPVDLTDIVLKSIDMANVLTEKARKRLPKEGGLNIEGLSSGSDGVILVGFRSPLSGADGMSGNALILSLLPTGRTFEVGKLSELDLENRGVRDIVKDGPGYVIVAGPVATEGKFALYTWNGNNALHKTKSLDDLNAEGILDLGRQWLILSDDGKVKRADDGASDGMRTCDKIRSKNSPGETHPSVFFRAKIIPKD